MQELKIIFMGTPEFGAIVLEGLIKNDLRPVLVITETDKPVGRKQILTPPPVKLLAQKYNINIIQPAEIRSTKSEIQNLKPDLIVVTAYGQILPKEILEIPKYGCLNVHPSLLPKYRGPSPIQHAILNGDEETGVTIIKMTEKVDAGEIVTSIKHLVSRDETYETLHNKLAREGAKLLIEALPKWIKGEIKPQPQEESKATYTKLFKKENGLIDRKKPIDYIERQIRALNPWPGAFTLYNGKILKILKAEISDNKLVIKEVQLEGKKPMAFEEFMRGHQDFIC